MSSRLSRLVFPFNSVVRMQENIVKVGLTSLYPLDSLSHSLGFLFGWCRLMGIACTPHEALLFGSNHIHCSISFELDQDVLGYTGRYGSRGAWMGLSQWRRGLNHNPWSFNWSLRIHQQHDNRHRFLPCCNQCGQIISNSFFSWTGLFVGARALWRFWGLQDYCLSDWSCIAFLGAHWRAAFGSIWCVG